jgi:hypothetical protein
MTTPKEQYWHEVRPRIAQMTDKLGKDVDAEIAEAVVALNALGILTSASCEGHLDHGTGARGWT